MASYMKYYHCKTHYCLDSPRGKALVDAEHVAWYVLLHCTSLIWGWIMIELTTADRGRGVKKLMKKGCQAREERPGDRWRTPIWSERSDWNALIGMLWSGRSDWNISLIANSPPVWSNFWWDKHNPYMRVSLLSDFICIYRSRILFAAGNCRRPAAISAGKRNATPVDFI